MSNDDYQQQTYWGVRPTPHPSDNVITLYVVDNGVNKRGKTWTSKYKTSNK